MKVRHRARWGALTVGLAVAIFGVILATQVNNEPTYKGGVVLGKPAPTVSLEKLGGGTVTSAVVRCDLASNPPARRSVEAPWLAASIVVV